MLWNRLWMMMLLLLLLAGRVVEAQRQQDGGEAARLAEIEQLKDTIHTLPAPEAARRFAALRRRTAPPPRQDKIDHFVVLMMENQAALRHFGCMDLPGFDGIPEGGLVLPVDPANESAGTFTVSCGTGEYVCAHSPKFSFMDGFFGRDVNASFFPYPTQSLQNAGLHGANSTAAQMFSAEQLPIKAAVAKSFGVFNKLFTASPTMSWPNHMFAQTGTSCGVTRTGPGYDEGGGPTKMYPQFTICE
jgi:phospholipase C